MGFSIIIQGMVRRTLLDFFEDLSQIDGDFVVFDDGYRAWTFTYRDVAAASRAFTVRLREAGVAADDKIVLWSENRAEWLAVLWGCLLERVVLVPVDYRSPAELVLRIADIVEARGIVVGETVNPLETPRPIWPIREVTRSVPGTQLPDPDPVGPTPDTTAEIIFTSGATADPKGVVLTH